MIETPAQILSHYADEAAVSSFIAWRKIRKAPLTERAALLIAKTLAAIRAAGGDPAEALDMIQEHAWMTIKPEWYWRNKNAASRQGQPAHADAVSRRIAFAAATPRSPRPDWH